MRSFGLLCLRRLLAAVFVINLHHVHRHVALAQRPELLALPLALGHRGGGLGLLAFVGIVLSSLAAAIRTRPDPLEVRSQRAGIVAAFGAAGVWFVIGHAAISTARGFALTMMLVAMAHALHARGQEGPSRAALLDSPRTNDG